MSKAGNHLPKLIPKFGGCAAKALAPTSNTSNAVSTLEMMLRLSEKSCSEKSFEDICLGRLFYLAFNMEKLFV